MSTAAHHLPLVLDRDGTVLLPTDILKAVTIECQQFVELLLHILYGAEQNRMVTRAGHQLDLHIAVADGHGHDLDDLGAPEGVILYIFYKVNQFEEIFIPFVQLFLILALGLLTCRHGIYAALVFALRIAVFAPQIGLVRAQASHTLVEIVMALEDALLDEHAPHRPQRVGYLLLLFEQWDLLVLELHDTCLRLFDQRGDIVLNISHILCRHGRRVASRNHGHIYGRQRRRWKYEPVGGDIAVVAVHTQPQRRPPLRNLHTQHAVV